MPNFESLKNARKYYELGKRIANNSYHKHCYIQGKRLVDDPCHVDTHLRNSLEEGNYLEELK
jgi:hypothetical protein